MEEEEDESSSAAPSTLGLTVSDNSAMSESAKMEAIYRAEKDRLAPMFLQEGPALRDTLTDVLQPAPGSEIIRYTEELTTSKEFYEVDMEEI